MRPTAFLFGVFAVGGAVEEGNIGFGMNSGCFGTNLPQFGTNLLHFGINLALGPLRLPRLPSN